MSSVCEICGKETQFTCSVCKAASYCSQQCQGVHWPVHKQTCKAPGSAWEAVALYSVLLADHRGQPGLSFAVNHLSISELTPRAEVALLGALLRCQDASLTFNGQYTEAGLQIIVTTPRHQYANFQYLMPMLRSGKLGNCWGQIAASKQAQAVRESTEVALRMRSMAPLHMNDGSHAEYVITGGISIDNRSGVVMNALEDAQLISIFRYLSLQDLCRVSQVSHRFHRLASDDSLWAYCYWFPAEHVDAALRVEAPFGSAVELFLRGHQLLTQYLAMSQKRRVLQHINLRADSRVCNACGVPVTSGHHLRHSRTMLAVLKQHSIALCSNLSLMCHRCYLLCAVNFATLRTAFAPQVPKSFWSDSELLARRNFTHNSAKSVLWLDVRTLLREEAYRKYQQSQQQQLQQIHVKEVDVFAVPTNKQKAKAVTVDTSSLVVGQIRDASFLDAPPPITMPAPQPAQLVDQNVILLQQMGFIKRAMFEGALVWEEIPGGVEQPTRGKKKLTADDEEFELSGEVEEEEDDEISSEEYSASDEEDEYDHSAKRSRISDELDDVELVEDVQFEAVTEELKQYPQEVLDMMNLFGHKKEQCNHPEYKEAEGMWAFQGEAAASQLSFEKGDKIVLYFWSDEIGWSIGALQTDRFAVDGRLKLGVLPNNYVKITRKREPPAPAPAPPPQPSPSPAKLKKEKKKKKAFTGQFVSRADRIAQAQAAEQKRKQEEEMRPTRRSSRASTRASTRRSSSRRGASNRKRYDEYDEDEFIVEDEL